MGGSNSGAHFNKPDLLISGINYGENLGTNVTTSGTIGAALEAASFGIPSIAISKQTGIGSHHRHTDQDWSVSSHFLSYFANALLKKTMPSDVDILKIDVPDSASFSTPWKLSKLAKTAYYSSSFPNPTTQSKIGDAKVGISIDVETLDPNTDIYVFAVDKCVSVTPLSLDLTSRTDLDFLKRAIEN